MREGKHIQAEGKVSKNIGCVCVGGGAEREYKRKTSHSRSSKQFYVLMQVGCKDTDKR